jgi:hypothetical protein
MEFKLGKRIKPDVQSNQRPLKDCVVAVCARDAFNFVLDVEVNEWEERGEEGGRQP